MHVARYEGLASRHAQRFGLASIVCEAMCLTEALENTIGLGAGDSALGQFSAKDTSGVHPFIAGPDRLTPAEALREALANGRRSRQLPASLSRRGQMLGWCSG